MTRINPYDEGEYITEFCDHFSSKIRHGMQSIHWSFGPNYYELNSNEKAKALLANEWAIKYTATKIRCIDGFGKWYQFRRNFDVILDKFDRFIIYLKRPFIVKNPYV